MQSALTFSGGRRFKWLVALFWLVVFMGLNAANIFERYSDAEKNRTLDYYPEKADSIQLLERIDEFPSGERFAAVVVYRRDGGLTAGDRAAIADHRRQGSRWRSRARPA